MGTEEDLLRRIARRLAGSAPQPPERVRVPGLGDLPAALAHLKPPRLTPAAVLIPLLAGDDGPRVLLTQRTEHLKHHPGQISFPGGRVEADDAGVAAAALREAEEEVGLPPEQVQVVGYLDNYLTITGYTVTPVVGFVHGDFEPRLDEEEVADAFEVPLPFLLDPANRRLGRRRLLGVEVPIYEFLYGERRIWGATAGIIVSFREKIDD